MVRLGVFAAVFAAFAVPAGAVPLPPTIETNGGTGSVSVTTPAGLDMRINIVGSDNGTGGFNPDLEDVAVETLVTFFYDGLTPFTMMGSWYYEVLSFDGPAWDIFGYVLDGSINDLSEYDFDLTEQSGTFSFLVNPQSTFGFYIYSVDNANGPATVRIDVAEGVIPMPAPIPLPASAALMLPALGALGLMRRRAKARS